MKEGANIVIEGQKRVIDEILARKKLKQSYEYEVSFKAMSSSEKYVDFPFLYDLASLSVLTAMTASGYRETS